MNGRESTKKAYQAHRHSFIGNSDLKDIASLGIRLVRLPLTWAAFADALVPIDPWSYGKHDPDRDTAIVPDPYHVEAHFATVPRLWLVELLQRCSYYGLKVVFDLHAFPGGSSEGTYNGVWPLKPSFWTKRSAIGNKSVELAEAGLWVARALVHWVETLGPEASAAVEGLSFMNEPAHLSTKAKEPWASEAQVLRWLEVSAQYFRASILPSRGKKLYVQIIDTAFNNLDATVVPWFQRTFSKTERQKWAVIDIHWYLAWAAGSCDGRVSPDGGFTCDQPPAVLRMKLRECIQDFTATFVRRFDGLKACTEFSAGTYEKARYACTDSEVLHIFLEEQVRAFNESGIESHFWTWKMPYGQIFEPGWSLKHLAGLETRPALPCLP